MKQEALLLDRPEDFKHYGINPNTVEEWEDGVRDTSGPNHFEWWYFDCMLDDGTKAVIPFLSKNGRTFSSNKFHPTPFYKVTTPDGRQTDKELHIPASADRTMDRSGALIYEIMCPGEKCVELIGNAAHSMQTKEENV